MSPLHEVTHKPLTHNRSDTPRFVHFNALQNASKCSALRLGNCITHRATPTTMAATQRPHGDTRGPLGCQSRAVRGIHGTTVVAPILPPASANPCKTLQSASNRVKPPMQINAISCKKVLRNVAKCFVLNRSHLCIRPLFLSHSSVTEEGQHAWALE